MYNSVFCIHVETHSFIALIKREEQPLYSWLLLLSRVLYLR